MNLKYDKYNSIEVSIVKKIRKYMKKWNCNAEEAIGDMLVDKSISVNERKWIYYIGDQSDIAMPCDSNIRDMIN